MSEPDDHEKVLRFLAEGYDGESFFSFAPIMEATGLCRQRVRFVCRHLKRKGFTEFSTALWNEDGEPCGAGYAITKAGRAAIAANWGLK